jgi:hypothetical protein
MRTIPLRSTTAAAFATGKIGSPGGRSSLYYGGPEQICLGTPHLPGQKFSVTH